jgi:hypothetical protein
MQSTRFVQRSHAALLVAVCVGLVSPALTWADDPHDRPLVCNSVPDLRNSDVDTSASRVTPLAEPGEELSRAQLQETADYLLSELGVVLQNLVFTMVFFDMPSTASVVPVPDTFVPPILQPPPSLTDDPNGPPPPPPPPPPPQQSPEPGTLVAGLVGAGAFLVRYYRRHRAKVPAIGGSEGMREKEVELVM